MRLRQFNIWLKNLRPNMMFGRRHPRVGMDPGLAWCCMQMRRHIALIIPVLSSRWAALTSHWDRGGSALGPFGQHRVRHENFNGDFHSYEKFAAKKFQPIGVIRKGVGGRGACENCRQAEQTFMKIFASTRDARKWFATAAVAAYPCLGWGKQWKEMDWGGGSGISDR